MAKFTLAHAATVAALVAACSTQTTLTADDPEPTGGGSPATGGSGGDGSGGGSSTTGGEAPSTGGVPAGGDGPGECTRALDCDDGLHCNGAERCESGSCAPGVAPDCNPNPDACEATCEEGADAHVCVVVPRDADGDGAPSAACIEASTTGTDCDDDDEDIHPGADDEDCDGVDADCDGVADIDESGAVLSGAATRLTAPVGAYNAIVADGAYGYSADLRRFAIYTSSPMLSGDPLERSFYFPDGPGSAPGASQDFEGVLTNASQLAEGHDGFAVLGLIDWVLTLRRLDDKAADRNYLIKFNGDALHSSTPRESPGYG